MSNALHIHIMGASGSGATTLGLALSRRLDLSYHDTDTFYWMPTVKPFSERRSAEERLQMMRRELDPNKAWILSGSLDGWGDEFITLFTVVIFLILDPITRIRRIRDREFRNFGSAVLPGGERHAETEAFIGWSSGYDLPSPPPGRSRIRHEAWLKNKVSVPVIRLESAVDQDILVQRALDALKQQRCIE